MKIAAHMLAYNVDRYFPSAVASLLPHVDKLYVAYPSRPFSYIAESRASLGNPTPKSIADPFLSSGKIEILEGDWEREEQTRNACLSRAEQDGFDWLLTIDADEFYTDESWEQIMRFLRMHPELKTIATTWYNFYKSAYFVAMDQYGSIKSTNANFALRCNQGIRFADRRIPSDRDSVLLDTPCFHYGYVLTDDEMYMKLKTWSHAKDFNTMRWFRLKWLGWRESTRNIHPTWPICWQRAIRFPMPQPSFAHEFALPHAYKTPSRTDRWFESAYDFVYESLELARLARNRVLGR
jgi:glycosyltransferase involved in cell wall biosynthesis